MSGKVLIIDELATNRIVLKVKLSAAYYDVAQATCVAEACALLPEVKPDVILLAWRRDVSDDLAQTIRRLRGPKANGPSVIALFDTSEPQDRINALRAGAEDVLSNLTDEQVLLARLRRLMRRRLSDQELHLHELTAQAMGFSEAQQVFAMPGRIGLVFRYRLSACKLQARLAPHTCNEIHLMSTEEVMSARMVTPHHDKAIKRPWVDIFIIEFCGNDEQKTLRLLSELRAGVSTRHGSITAIVPPGESALAVQVLDMGAADVIFADTATEEIALRLDLQLQRKRQRDLMRDQLQDGLRAAVIDPLTGLYNRRYAMSYLKCLLEGKDTGQPGFAVMLVDLDHFKRVNDTLGHAAGDAVLVRIANLMSNRLRRDDLISRIGGEEFLIILPETTQNEARRIAMDLCTIVRDTQIALTDCAQNVNVTISIGLTLARIGCLTAEEILNQADRALYRSKAEGRNTVRFNKLDAA